MNTVLSSIHSFAVATDFDAVETDTFFGCEIYVDLLLHALQMKKALRCFERSESDYPLIHPHILQERKSLCICVTKPYY